MEELISKAEELFEKCRVCAVSAVTKDGYPRVCMLYKIKNDGIKQIWFATGMSTQKVEDYLCNPKAGVTFDSDGNDVMLTGKMEVVTNRAEKDSVWQDWMDRFYPNGGKNDPEFTPLKFTAEEATIYIEDAFERYKL